MTPARTIAEQITARLRNIADDRLLGHGRADFHETMPLRTRAAADPGAR